MSKRNQNNNSAGNNKEGRFPSNNSKNNSRKGRPNNNRHGKGREGDIPSNKDLGSATNDPKDYQLDAQLLKDVASIPFSWATGTPLNLNNALMSTTPSKGNFTIPGILALGVVPTVGTAKQASDPVNVCANRIYSYVRHANSGSKNYDAPDLMLYLLAVANVYGMIMHLQRIYGMIGTYSTYNRYLPNTLIQAAGMDAKDVIPNLANFRARLNMLIYKAASFAVPSSMPYFKNMAESFGNYYSEGTSMKDQIYIIRPVGLYKYKLNDDLSGMLKFEVFADNTVKYMLDYAEDMLSRLIYSEDMNLMSGDILKAYGSEGIYKLATVSEDYSLLPIMDIPVLEQIKNATTCGMVYNETGAADFSVDITQSTDHSFLNINNTITTHNRANSNATAANARALALQSLDEDRFMTTSTKDVTPELVMENSKYMVAADGYTHTPGSETATITLYPRTFIPYYFTIYEGDVSGTGIVSIVDHVFSYATPVNLDDKEELKAFIHRLSVIQHFKFAPIMHPLGYTAGTTAPAVKFAEGYIFQDVDNYAIISDSTLRAMHEAALMALFHLTSIAQK